VNLSRIIFELVVLLSTATVGAGCAAAQATTQAEALPDAPSAVLRAHAAPAGTGSESLDREPHAPVEVRKTPGYVISDLGHIAISPVYLRKNDLKWLVPLAGASIAAFSTDETTMTEVVSTNPSFNSTSANVSDALRDGFIAAPVALFGAGELGNHPHMRETGLLGGVAMVDALVVDEVVKLCTFRERPYVDNGEGQFFRGSAGVDSSFISGHSMIAWSSAAVMAGEYNRPWQQVAIYSGAAGVSLTRVMAQQHFPTDVLLGSAGGWLIGHYVFRAHHHRDRDVAELQH
jgi:membrane-associated phospholipid phosphatase